MSETCFEEKNGIDFENDKVTGKELPQTSPQDDSTVKANCNIEPIVYKGCDLTKDQKNGINKKLLKDKEIEDLVYDNLQAFHIDGDVYECRILLKGSAKIYTGYYDDFRQLAHDIVAYDRNQDTLAIYISLNPVKNELLARGANALRVASKDSTKDHEVSRRRFLLVDIDPNRAADISSSEEEKRNSLELAHKIKNFLAEQGWTEPFIIDSGNGSGLIYSIDLPNEKIDGGENVIEMVLKYLDKKFPGNENNGSSIDTSVSNPSRVRRLLGTMNRKGSNYTGENGNSKRVPRTWKRSDLISKPDSIVTVTKEQMLKLVSYPDSIPLENPIKTDVLPKKNTSQFAKNKAIVEKVLAIMKEKDGIESSSSQSNGGLNYDLKTCPMCGSDGAFVKITPDGIIGAGCQHDHCKGWNWKVLRAKFDSEYKTISEP